MPKRLTLLVAVLLFLGAAPPAHAAECAAGYKWVGFEEGYTHHYWKSMAATLTIGSGTSTRTGFVAAILNIGDSRGTPYPWIEGGVSLDHGGSPYVFVERNGSIVWTQPGASARVLVSDQGGGYWGVSINGVLISTLYLG